jgi:hypothetical protein
MNRLFFNRKRGSESSELNHTMALLKSGLQRIFETLDQSPQQVQATRQIRGMPNGTRLTKSESKLIADPATTAHPMLALNTAETLHKALNTIIDL